jgi:hypothetical protein
MSHLLQRACTALTRKKDHVQAKNKSLALRQSRQGAWLSRSGWARRMSMASLLDSQDVHIGRDVTKRSRSSGPALRRKSATCKNWRREMHEVAERMLLDA